MRVKVYADGYDITPWVTRASWSQAERTIHMSWSLTVSGIVDIDWTAAEVSIYAGYGATGLEPIVTGGRIAPDKPPTQTFGGAGVLTEVGGYDWVYFAQRRLPEQTLVFVGEHDSVEELVRGSDLPVGRYQVMRKRGSRFSASGIVSSQPWMLHEVVSVLASYAGFGAQTASLPGIEMAPFVADPTKSYFQVMVDLLEPLRAEMFYRHENGVLVVVDALAYPTVGLTGSAVTVAAKTLSRISGSGLTRRRRKRILIQAPLAAQRPICRVS